MITYSKIGKKGHLGNQLFQIASTIGLAVSNKHEFAFSKWKYQEYFKNKLPLLALDLSSFINVEEKEYNFYQWHLHSENYDVSGWLQTERYFDKGLTKHYFEFSDSLIDKIKNLYKNVFAKRTILLSIRRGDFVNHPDYFQLPINYYLNSLDNFFPDWESCNLIVLSDDVKYCKFHFSFLQNAFFGDGLNGIEQLCLGSLCDDFIISNSTFSWWTAWLGEKSDSKIVRPLKNFDGLKSKELNDKDYYPERWICYDHLNDRINLKDTFIAIPKKNTILENYLHHNFTFNNSDQIIKFDTHPFLNLESEGQLLVIYDCILPPFLIYSVSKNKLDCIGYLKGNFLNISKYLDKDHFKKQFDYGLFSKILSKKNKQSNTILFLLIQSKTNKMHFALNKNPLHIFKTEKKQFSVFNSYAGKIKGFPECHYYFKTQKRKIIFFFKSNIKALIKPFKK